MFIVCSGAAKDYRRAAEALRAEGEYADAALYLEATLEDNPNCLECWQLLGQNYEDNKQPLKALEAYQKLLGLAPNRQEVRERAAALKSKVKLDEKKDKKQRIAKLRRNSGWGIMAGAPSGLSFARRLQDIYMVSLLLGSRFDGQVAFGADLFARFPINDDRTSYFSFGLGWCMLAGGSETVGRTKTGKLHSVARETRTGPSVPVSLSRFFGGTEIFLRGSVVLTITPEREYLPEGGVGVRWYIE